MYFVAKSEQIFVGLKEGSALMTVLHRPSDQLSKLPSIAALLKRSCTRGCRYQLEHAFVLESFMDLAEVHNYYVCKHLVREKLKTSYDFKCDSRMDR